jgi:hypothetical protein
MKQANKFYKVLWLMLVVPAISFGQLYINNETVYVGATTLFVDGDLEIAGTGTLEFDGSSATDLSRFVITGDITGDAAILFNEFTSVELLAENPDVCTLEMSNPSSVKTTIYNLELGTGAQVIVPAGGGLATTNFDNLSTRLDGGGIFLQADALNQYSQFKYGNATNAGIITQQFYQNVDTRVMWRHIGPTVNTTFSDIADDITLSIAGPTTNIYSYDANFAMPTAVTDYDAINWIAPTSIAGGDVFGPGQKGYGIYLTESRVSNPDGVIEMTGEPLQQTPLALTLYNSYDNLTNGVIQDPTRILGWNAVLNKFNAQIDILEMLGDNPNFTPVYKAVHVWDETIDQYRVMNQLGATIIQYNNPGVVAAPADLTIAPGQMFWVKTYIGTTALEADAAEGDSVNLTLRPEWTTIEGNGTAFYKKEVPTIRLNVLGVTDNLQDQAVLFFDQATALDDMDVNDALKLNSTNINVPTLYTLSATTANKLAMNNLEMPEPSKTVAVAFKSNKSNAQYAISMNLENIDPTWFIQLEDTKKGTMHNMHMGEYTFANDVNYSESRFKLHINKMPIGIPTNTAEFARIFGDQNGLNVAFLNPTSTTAEVLITNLTGQLLYSGKVSTGSVFTYPVNASPSVYIVRVVSAQEVTTQKIVR